MRRISVRRSACGDGSKPSDSSLESTNASIGLRTQPSRSTSGGSGLTTGRRDHRETADAGSPGGSPHAAPSRIHFRNAAISDSASAPVGGICKVPERSIAWIRRLSSGLPGVIADPRPPPINADSRDASDSPLVRSASLWQPWQRVASTGRIFSSKNRVLSDCAAAVDTAENAMTRAIRRYTTSSIVVARVGHSPSRTPPTGRDMHESLRTKLV